MNPNACKDEDKVKQVIAMMKVTMMTDDQVQTMIARIHKGGDTKTSDQLRTMITEIQEGGNMYKGKGTGRWDEDEAEGVGRGSAYEGEGERCQAGRGPRLKHSSASHRFSLFHTKAAATDQVPSALPVP